MAVFDRLLRVFGRESPMLPEQGVQDAKDTIPEQDAASVWALAQGYSVSPNPSSGGYAIASAFGDKPWVMKRGPSSRDFIDGDELHARAELGVLGDVSVVVMTRPLKEDLERQAYAIYTDSLQTTVNTSLPEEMRWLAMYEEVVWDEVDVDFVGRFAVLADDIDHAVAWMQPALVELLMHWPDPVTATQSPFMITCLRGNVYLRMEYAPADLRTLQHAVGVLRQGCECALAQFKA